MKPNDIVYWEPIEVDLEDAPKYNVVRRINPTSISEAIGSIRPHPV